MRRLTLILSDLYLPEEAVPANSVAAPLALPGLSWLLRFAAGSTPVSDWRQWLAGELGVADLGGLAPAQVAARARLTPEVAASAWFATPVLLSARLDHVRLVDRGLLRVDPGDHAAWCSEFSRHFGPEFQLHPGNTRGFLLSGAAFQASTTDPARLLDCDVAPALPRGSDGLALRRLSAEIEMWLHTAPLNDARERARLPRISALWLWGGGSSVVAPQASSGSLDAISLYGEDAFLSGLAALASHVEPLPAPASLTALEGPATHHVVEFAPMSGDAQESLAVLDDNWFVPARTALAAGMFSSLDVVANDRCFRIAGRAGWRFWRRSRGWLDNLARDAQSAKA